MGLTIGQAPSLVGASRVRNVQSASFFDSGLRERPALLGQDESGNGPALLRQEDKEPIRVGFGPQTLSTPAAALNALQSTIRNVRESSPTLREINIGLRQDASEQRALIRERSERQFTERTGAEPAFFNDRSENSNRIQVRLPEPSAQARNFINTLNDAAGAAQARFSRDEEAPISGPSFQVNGERIALNRGPGTLLNLTA